MTPLRATRYSKSHAFQRKPIHCDVDHSFGRRDRKKLEKVKSYANEERFSPGSSQSDCFGVVSWRFENDISTRYNTPTSKRWKRIASLSWVCTVMLACMSSTGEG